MKNWKTTLFGIATLGCYVAAYFLPEHKDFINGLIPILIAGGFIVSKDFSNSGTGVRGKL